MFVTREYDYALRIVRKLSDGELYSVKQISTAEHVPQAYAYKILKKLEHTSIVEGLRGTHGGYRLAMPIHNVSLYTVYEAIEGALCLNECMQEGYHCPNNENGTQCRVHKELIGLQNALRTSMEGLTMGQILEVGEQKNDELLEA